MEILARYYMMFKKTNTITNVMIRKLYKYLYIPFLSAFRGILSKPANQNQKGMLTMPEQISEEHAKIDAYLDVIQSRIVEPIQNSDLDRYCTATLLLLFAAIDGLGKLIHNDDKAGSNSRIRVFLDYMGDKYRMRKKELLRLRHSLVHNAINVASFMSQTEEGSVHHLTTIGSAGFFYVNTNTMYQDFIRAFERLREEFKNDKAKLSCAAQRLEWREDDVEDHNLDVSPSPPPPIEFIHAR